jgi:phosphocarrier protein
MLAAHRGSVIEVETAGAQADDLAAALETLVSSRFGEDM